MSSDKLRCLLWVRKGGTLLLSAPPCPGKGQLLWAQSSTGAGAQLIALGVCSFFPALRTHLPQGPFTKAPSPQSPLLKVSPPSQPCISAGLLHPWAVPIPHQRPRKGREDRGGSQWLGQWSKDGSFRAQEGRGKREQQTGLTDQSEALSQLGYIEKLFEH